MADDRNDEERKTPSWQLPQERQPDTDAYHIWTPRPLLRSIYWKPDPAPPFETVSSTYEIFVDQRAWLTMHEHVWQTGADRTPFGYLIGDLCEDPNAGRRFVTVTAALPARFDFKEESREQISREATLALQLEVERRRGVLAGWYHRHLGGEVALTEADVATHIQHFDHPWQCAFVFVGGGDRSEGGCFRSTPRAFAGDLLLPFYEMASNESLLARGVKRSYLDWTNYTTVDEIRTDPPPRPRIELPSAAGGGGAADAELVVQAFDAEPQPPPAPPRPRRPEASRPAEDVSPAPPSEVSREEAPRPKEEAQVTPGEPAAPEPGAEPDSPEPAAAERRDEVDFEAAIEAVRSARIELDVEEGEVVRPVPKGEEREVGPEAAPPAEVAPAATRWGEDGEAPGPGAEAGRRASAAAPAWKNTRVLVGAGGALLLIAALVGSVLFFGGDPAAPDPGGEPEDAASAPAAGVAGVTAAAVDSAGREMLATISRFYGSAVAFDNQEVSCEQLTEAFVEVESAWITYNTEYKARFEGPLPAQLAARDERLYDGVQDAEREFDLTGCPRP